MVPTDDTGMPPFDRRPETPPAGLLDYVTHYYMPSRRPFENLSDLDDDEAMRVMADLDLERLAGDHHRRFGPLYLIMRRETERRLREAFLAVGGVPERRAPHYFVLGESPWFRGLATGMRARRIPLSELSEETASITYGDSFEAMRVGPEFGFGDNSEPRPYHAKVYRLSELESLMDRFGLPGGDQDEDYLGYEHRSVEKFIEVQVWSDHEVGAQRHGTSVDRQ